MHTYEYPRPSVTATIALVVDNHTVVQGRRGREDGTFAGYWSLFGGFLNAKTNIFEGETVQECIVREVQEELSFDIDPANLVLINVYSDPATDPRAHVVNVFYAYHISEAEYYTLSPNEEIAQLRLSPYIFDDKLAFNHLDLMKDLYFTHLRRSA